MNVDDRVWMDVMERASQGASVPADRGAVAVLARRHAPLTSAEELREIVERVMARLHGLGTLQRHLLDPDVTDVMVTGGRGVWVERLGRLERVADIGADEAQRLIERVVGPLGRRIDRSSPLVDARLPDGSRVHAVVPPVAIDGPTMTIRRFGARSITLEEFCSPAVSALLTTAVAERRNILVSGGTGSGKTTLLNALGTRLDADERIITIEDAAELRLPVAHLVRLESRPANSDGLAAVSIRDLVRAALRMRPDRIIIGEVRSAEALDMLQAMNTGHEGSMSTCHANSPRDALRRLETMVLFAETGLPLEAVRSQIAASLDLVVQVCRGAAGARRITEVAEVGDDARSVVPVADHQRVIGPLARPARSTRGGR